MKITFRRAVLPRDRHALVAVDHQVFPKWDWFAPEYWDELESYWMIADGKRVGCCAFERHSDFQDDPEADLPRRRLSLYIASTGILPEYQGKGLGDRFKGWQIAWARRHGFTRIVTNSRRSNRAMIRLNQKHGFEIIRVTAENYYSRPAEPAVEMELLLPPAVPAPSGTDEIVALLIAERDRVERALAALTGKCLNHLSHLRRRV